MRVVRGYIWMLFSLGLVLPCGVQGLAQTAAANVNRVIVYPNPGETIAQLKQGGIAKVDDCGSYWIVEATDAQAESLGKSHGHRAFKANDLTKIELAAASFDTALGEPSVPGPLRQSLTAGQRLRLVQFKGPVQSEWLAQVQAAGNVRLISYIPNNAYLVWIDQAAEDSLGKLLAPAGPIRWLGAYHPYYKMRQSLQNATAPTVDVRIAVLNGPEAGQTINTIEHYNLNPAGKPTSLLNQVVVQANVRTADLPGIAGLADVLWIQRVFPTKNFGEEQGLVLVTSDEGPAPARYLDFLTNTVGFSTDPSTYPVVDIADSGLDTPNPHCSFPFPEAPYHPDFYLPSFPVSPNAQCCGLTPSRVVYDVSGPISNGLFNVQPDTDGHGTFVASVVAGFDTEPDEVINCFTEGQLIVTNSFLKCVTNVTINCDGSTPPNCTNSTVITCTTFVQILTNCLVQENVNSGVFPAFIARQYSNGEQFGLGVSPFGRIGASAGGANTNFLGPADEALNAYLRLARISNNSWGEILFVGENDGGYDALSQEYDALVRDAVTTGSSNTPGPNPLNQELVYVFAGGNANGADQNGGFGDVLVTPPATAKNVITVGASTLDGSLSSFTSFGPTEDGRFKPDVLAPGEDIAGAISQASYGLQQCGGCDPNNPSPADCDTGFFTTSTITELYGIGAGTSFAAPAVAGAAQLLWWYFENRLSMLQPSPAMVKAYICNSALYIPSPDPLYPADDRLPSIAEGMGRMDLQRMFDGEPRVLRDESTPRAIDIALLTTNPVPQQTYFSHKDESYQVSGVVADATQPFRVTLAWTDPPGNPVAAVPQLVNNLDLEVTIDGQTYLGNVFDTQYSVVDPNRGADTLNNMESVFLPAGQTGTWSVVVFATDLNGNAVPNVKGSFLGQDFALVVYNAKASPQPSDVPNLNTNDSCQTAEVISGFPFAWTNTLSASVYHTPNPSSSAGIGGPQEFFEVPLPTPGTTIFANTFGSGFDTVLSVWKGNCGALMEVTANDNSSNTLQSSVSWAISDTNEYFIMVEGRAGATGHLLLNVTASAPPVTFSPTSLNFGTELVGSTSAIARATLNNGSANNMDVSSAMITGPDAANFKIVSEETCNQILPGNSCVFLLEFIPLGAGTFTNASLTVRDNITGSPHILPLSGIGMGASSVVCLNSSGLTFGTTAIGFTSAVQSVTLENCGTTALTVSNIVISGSASNDYFVSADACTGAGISSGGTCSFDVSFAPTASGSRRATLTINNNSTNGPVDIALNGIGEAPAAAACAGPGAVDFGNQPVNTTSAGQSVTITNCGSQALDISTVTVSGPDAGEFTLSGNTCNGAGLPINGTCSFTVTFAPTNPATQSASIIISNNSATDPLVVPLSGTGTGSQPDVAIGRGTGLKQFVGRNVFTPPSLLSKQTLTEQGGRGSKHVFYLLFQNTGNVADVFDVTVNETLPGATARYFLGAKPSDSTEVTSQVESQAFTTATLGPGAYTGDATMLRVEIDVGKKAAKGTNSVVITATSPDAVPARSDQVQAVVIFK